MEECLHSRSSQLDEEKARERLTTPPGTSATPMGIYTLVVHVLVDADESREQELMCRTRFGQYQASSATMHTVVYNSSYIVLV